MQGQAFYIINNEVSMGKNNVLIEPNKKGVNYLIIRENKNQYLDSFFFPWYQYLDFLTLEIKSLIFIILRHSLAAQSRVERFLSEIYQRYKEEHWPRWQNLVSQMYKLNRRYSVALQVG